ncbi:DUF3304 domain-containing protein [Stenotrophomonas sp. LGBM10]|uniref:DUF3304 domain-containing protein n=1 Tax=Stenotrophomonas sp. LGBM10 TaxID=3390038 RepID=UPI00398B1A41
MTHDAGPDRPDGADDGDLRALLWFVADCVVTVLFTAALWQASGARSEELLFREAFMRIVPLMMLLFVNGARRLIRNYHRGCFQRLPAVQCVAAPWMVAMSYIQVWCVASTGSDLPDNPDALYFVAAPMTVGAALAYTMLAGKLRGVANPDKEGDAQRSISQSWQTTPQEPTSREPNDVTDDQTSMTDEDLRGRLWWLLDSATAAFIVYAMVSILPAFSPRARPGGVYPRGEDPATFAVMMWIAMFVVSNGMRRVIRSASTLTTEQAAIAQTACGGWFAALILVVQHLYYVQPYGRYLLPLTTTLMMIPVTLIIGALYYSARTEAEVETRPPGLEETPDGVVAEQARKPIQWSNLAWTGIVLGFVVLIAIGQARTKPPEAALDRRFSTSLTSMDYEPTDTFVHPVYVDGGGGDSAGTGGSTALRAISLPVRWHPGLTVRVKWQRCKAFYADNPQTEEQACRWVEKHVPVHPYTDVGSTTVHLFADDQILVIPAMLGPRHEDYPGSPPPYKNFYEKRGIGHDE